MQNTHDLLVGTLSIGIPSLLLKNSQLTPPFWYVFMSANHHKRLREHQSGAEIQKSVN